MYICCWDLFLDYTGEGIMDAVGVITSAGRDLEDLERVYYDRNIVIEGETKNTKVTKKWKIDIMGRRLAKDYILFIL